VRCCPAEQPTSASDWADRFMAYGPVFYSFLMLFVAGVILSVAMRRAEAPYIARPIRDRR
jgi:hypothetical protein